MIALVARELDVCVLGATGYTGRLVADYLAARAGAEKLRWALVGRNAAKLEAVQREVGSPPVIVADALDRAAMDKVAARTRVICTTAGPYTKYGSEVVAACAANGTHYCDLTGEVNFMRAMIDAHHERARQTGARIVHACGFDSIPSDLGAWCAQREYIARFGTPATSIEALFAFKGTFSGGTIASMMTIADRAGQDKDLRRLLGNPYGLDPDPTLRHAKVRDIPGIAYDRRAGKYTAPFVMATTNTRVVRRSHALAGFPWGNDFTYREVMATKSLASAVGMTAGIAGMAAVISQKWLRGLVAKRLPAPGEGPSREAREHGFWRADHYADGPAGALVYSCGDHFDPGYGSTSRMLGEAALCLAKDELDSAGGVTTPSVAMGDALAERLRAAGLTFAPSYS